MCAIQEFRRRPQSQRLKGDVMLFTKQTEANVISANISITERQSGVRKINCGIYAKT